MKKLGMFLAFALVMAFVMPSCKSVSPLEKARSKQYKTKLAEYKKGGWTVFGTAKTLEVALLEHYEQLEKEGTQEIMGVATAFMSKNIGKQAALTFACNEYALQARSYVKGRVITDLFNNPDDVPTEFEHFYAAYETMVAKEIQGELKPTFSIIRSRGKDDSGKETFEMHSFFVVNENEASKARIQAMLNAMNESRIAQEYAEHVSRFVQEGFEIQGY